MADPEDDNIAKSPPNPKDRKRISSETAILARNSRFRRPSSKELPGRTASLREDQREILLVIRGMVERLLLSENMPVVLGRDDLASRFHPDVDMTPYGGEDRGVSRAHARLHLQGRKLFVTDMGSTNGTFVAGKRLTPNKPEPLRKGDELLLGRLAIQVLF